MNSDQRRPVFFTQLSTRFDVSDGMPEGMKDTAKQLNELGNERDELAFKKMRGESMTKAELARLRELNEYSGRLVEIAGWGQCTFGDLGWRAQHAKVVRELI